MAPTRPKKSNGKERKGTNEKIQTSYWNGADKGSSSVKRTAKAPVLKYKCACGVQFEKAEHHKKHTDLFSKISDGKDHKISEI